MRQRVNIYKDPQALERQQQHQAAAVAGGTPAGLAEDDMDDEDDDEDLPQVREGGREGARGHEAHCGAPQAWNCPPLFCLCLHSHVAHIHNLGFSV